MTLYICKVSIIPDLEPKRLCFMLTLILLFFLWLNIKIFLFSSLGSGNQPSDLLNLNTFGQGVCIYFRQLGKDLLRRELLLMSSRLSGQTHYWAHFNTPSQVTPVSIIITYSVSPWVHSLCATLISFFRSLFIPWSFLFQSPNWLQWRSCLSPRRLTPAVAQTFAENKLHEIIISIFCLTLREKHSLTSVLVQRLSVPPQTSVS